VRKEKKMQKNGGSGRNENSKGRTENGGDKKLGLPKRGKHVVKKGNRAARFQFSKKASDKHWKTTCSRKKTYNGS